jgi:D-alanyl-D-alanine carboxypeptidase/D-alanyl-D-alanine-endopeptidase (penicillin-binding protein 4)
VADLSLLQQDALTAARLADALQPAHDVAVCTSWADLEARLVRRETDVCVVDADQPSRQEAMDRLTTLQQSHPTIAMVAFGDFAGQEQTVYRLGRLGVDGVVAAQRGTESVHVREAVDQALLAARARRAATLLEGQLPPFVRRAVAWAVEHAGRRPPVQELADAMGTTPAAFAAELRREGLPPPSRILLWGRLLLAGALLDRDRTTVEQTAYQVGYSGASALARALKREVGRTPVEIAARGGMEEVHRRLVPPGRGDARGRLRLVLVALLLALHAACASPHTAGPRAPDGVPGSGVAARVERILAEPPLDGLHVGILAVDARSGRTVLERNAARRFIPASNQKLLTVAAALHHLGPDFRWETALWSDAPVVDGSLQGDLVLVGTGDPTLSERWWPSARSALDALADSLRAAGVRRVDGDLVVDVSAWERSGVPGPWEVGDLPFPWGAAAGAFAVAEGEISLLVRGGARVGDPARLEAWWPGGARGFLRPRLHTAPPDSTTRVRGRHLPGEGILAVEGWVPAGRADTVHLAAREPVRVAAGLLRTALEGAGIRIAGRTGILAPPGGAFSPPGPAVESWAVPAAASAGRRAPGGGVGSEPRSATRPAPPVWLDGPGARGPDSPTPANHATRRATPCVGAPGCAGLRRLAALRSPPLSAVAAEILGPSRNWVAEQLLRTLGRIQEGRGTREAGLAVVRSYLLEAAGVDSLDIRLEDGSGLAPRNLVTPRAVVAVLAHAAEAPWSQAWRRALASPGEEDTTLERRLPDLHGRVAAKTGTLSNVDALSGYLSEHDGTDLIFSVLSNGSGLPASTVRRALDRVVEILAEG